MSEKEVLFNPKMHKLVVYNFVKSCKCEQTQSSECIYPLSLAVLTQTCNILEEMQCFSEYSVLYHAGFGGQFGVKSFKCKFLLYPIHQKHFLCKTALISINPVSVSPVPGPDSLPSTVV